MITQEIRATESTATEIDLLKKDLLESVKKVQDISNDFVQQFYKLATEEERAWIKERIAYHVRLKGDVKYFAAFRSEFAKHFFAELFREKRRAKRPSLLDSLEAIDRQQ